MVTSGFTNGGLWKGEGKRGIKNRCYLGFWELGFGSAISWDRGLGEYGFEHTRIKGFFTCVNGERYQVLVRYIILKFRERLGLEI